MTNDSNANTRPAETAREFGRRMATEYEARKAHGDAFVAGVLALVRASRPSTKRGARRRERKRPAVAEAVA